MNVMTDVIHACGYVRVIMYACGWYTCVCVCVCMHVVYVQEYMCGIRAGIHVWYTCRNTCVVYVQEYIIIHVWLRVCVCVCVCMHTCMSVLV